jgi:hypothetical protein
MKWLVRNSIGAAGLPVGDWATAARVLLRDNPDVHTANIVATIEEDEVVLDGSRLVGLEVEVVIVAGDADVAAKTVERSVTAALFDVVGDREVGWSAYDWSAEPASR